MSRVHATPQRDRYPLLMLRDRLAQAVADLEALAVDLADDPARSAVHRAAADAQRAARRLDTLMRATEQGRRTR